MLKPKCFAQTMHATVYAAVYLILLVALTCAADSQAAPLTTSLTTPLTTSLTGPVQTALQPADTIFVALREAARNNDAVQAAELAKQIANYPVPSYIEYFTLKPQLFDALGHARYTVPDDAVLAFLQKYDGQAIADRMRNDYLLVLGARHAWQDFNAQYQRFLLDDDVQVKCYALEARAAQGEDVAAAARALLIDPRQYGDGCVDLVSALARQQQLTTDDIWQQVRLAFEANRTAVGKQLASALNLQRTEQALLEMASTQPAALLTQIQPSLAGQLNNCREQKINHEETDLANFAQQIERMEACKDSQRDLSWSSARAIKEKNTAIHQLALLATMQMAHQDPQAAATAFTSVTPKLTLQERAIGWGAIAYQAALKQLPSALNWYRLSIQAPLSNTNHEWRVRAALRAGDWQMVRWAISVMPDTLRNQPKWVYWFGRALQATGEAEQASQYFVQIASNFDFYGQLAAEELGKPINLPPRATVTPAEIEPMKTVPGFQLAQRFYAIDLPFEGSREWNWALRGMNDRQLLAAAEFARRLALYERVISTAQRTRQEHDFSLRYIAPFHASIARYARLDGLAVEWVYGLIRQESRFLANARSGVGAIGMMQLMPSTAQTIARKVGLKHFAPAQLSNVDTNLRLGMGYLAMVYHQFDASAVLASASYNAGPHRVQQWQAMLPQRTEGAIFIETIPFDETRDYVKNVLANTRYYAILLGSQPKSLKAWLGTVEPY